MCKLRVSIRFQPSVCHYCVDVQILTNPVLLVQRIWCLEVRKKSINRLIAAIRQQADKSVRSTVRSFLFYFVKNAYNEAQEITFLSQVVHV